MKHRTVIQSYKQTQVLAVTQIPRMTLASDLIAVSW